MIAVQRLTKKYGKQLANDNISLAVRAEEIGVLLGPNGAGKSTLIKSICGLLRFQGSVSIAGYDNRSVEAKRLLGYVPEIPTPYPMLTADEHLEFIARAYRLRDWKERADDLLRSFDMDDKRNKLGKELSKGMQQKVGVCCALLSGAWGLLAGLGVMSAWELLVGIACFAAAKGVLHNCDMPDISMLMQNKKGRL